VELKKPTAIICLSPYSGGMELDAIKLAKKLSDSMPLILIAKQGCFIEKKCSKYFGSDGITLETLAFKSSISLAIIIQARKIVKKYNIKNVIFFGASELKSLYFAFLGLDVNLIVRHGTTKSRPKKDWFHKLIYSKVNCHVSISKHLKENVKYIIPFGKNTQSKLIYSSFEFNDAVPKPHKKLTLLHVGRIARGKGQIDALQACEILIKNNIDFVFNIVGGFDECYKEEFLNFYENYAYKNKINLAGFNDNIQQYLQTADIFLFPSHGEGFGNAFIEALANNLVCISYDNTIFPEFQSMGFFFEICENRNIEALQTKLLECVQNLQEKMEKSQKNISIVKEIFSEKKEIENYLKILK